MKEFIEYILQYGHLNEQQIDLITSKGTEIKLRKIDYFAEAGKVLRQMGFSWLPYIALNRYPLTGTTVNIRSEYPSRHFK
ncbi:hypothetical protein [uncultured Zobellia sp.]|uniref:hypothetical protein n=1 Tax=uncultured Zobellia sp. TaxID=255433 RepID=UPI0025976F63|nr:hypothetical protein [uncultured Zobellia sp.]